LCRRLSTEISLNRGNKIKPLLMSTALKGGLKPDRSHFTGKGFTG
jgi:hypothetical protein